ncbi:MAG: beta-ketoacyl-[acyl-carrier-protein] synthase family protein, partial [Nanoarchaeota archaeon]
TRMSLAVGIQALSALPGFVEKYFCANPTQRIKEDNFYHDMSCFIGTGIGGVHSLEKGLLNFYLGGDMDKLDPQYITRLMINAPEAILVQLFGLRAGGFAISSACATGTDAIGAGIMSILAGYAPVSLVGAVEAPITPNTLAHFYHMGALARPGSGTPQEASRPFDKYRSGFVMGEGGAAFVIADEEFAFKQGWKPIAEILSYSFSADAYSMTDPDPTGEGQSTVMRNALERAGINPDEVDYINAHGTATPYNDKFESIAIRNVFGRAADNIIVGSTKGAEGHLLGAAGAKELSNTIDTVVTGEVPPSLNLTDPDVENGCDLNYAPAQKVKLTKYPVAVSNSKTFTAISNSLAFGGHNSSLLIKKFEN